MNLIDKIVKTHFVDFDTDRGLDQTESGAQNRLNNCSCNLKITKINFNTKKQFQTSIEHFLKKGTLQF